MATIIETLHDLSHEVDRQPFDVVFLVRIRAKDKTVRSSRVMVSTTYEKLAWRKQEVTAIAEAQASDRRAAGEHLYATDICADALASPEVERELQTGYGYRGPAAPGFFNPVNCTFLQYDEHWISGKLVLAIQKQTFFRFCIVPEQLWSRMTDEAKIQVLVI